MKPFTKWKQRLLALQDGLSPSEKEQAAKDAGNWLYCKVGEDRERLEKLGVKFYADGSPQEFELFMFGSDFSSAVAGGRFDGALEVLKQIEAWQPNEQKEVSP